MKYKLRYLFYLKQKGWTHSPNIGATLRCEHCKKGSSSYIIWGMATGNSFKICPHCSEKFVGEPNKNLSKKLYVFWRYIIFGVRWVLDKLHILRYGWQERRDDEWQYIDKSHFSECGRIDFYRKRKFWEYIFIKK